MRALLHDGLSAVQTHMTNTLNTPIEVLEMNFPLRINRYQLRDGSGGAGLQRGGDGLVREFCFLAPATVTLLTERRRHAPWGLNGGAPGACGANRRGAELLPGKITLQVASGETLVLETPGGGGWGRPVAKRDRIPFQRRGMKFSRNDRKRDPTPFTGEADKGLCAESAVSCALTDRRRNAGMLGRMTDALARRGPDGSGTWFNGPVALGHRRLAVIDLSERAAQPMRDDAAGLALVFNGTIYNYPELRKELQALGHHFVSDGDTEVILRAYAEWGEDCPTRLHGMFAFAIWDSRRQQLFLARDRFGIKPLYYSFTRQGYPLRLDQPGTAGGRRAGYRHRPGGPASSLHPACRGAGAAHPAARPAQAGARLIA